MDALASQINSINAGLWGSTAIVALRITLIAIVAWILAAVLNRMIRLFRARIASRLTDGEQVKRAETIGRVFRYIVSVVLSLITTVTNMSRGHAQAVVDVGIAYREDTDDAFEVMRAVGREMREDAVFGPKISADLEIAGVEAWADSAVMLRCRFKVLPLEQWNVRREFLRCLKKAFKARGIEIPFPHLTVYAGAARDGTAPPFPLVRLQETAPPRVAG